MMVKGKVTGIVANLVTIEAYGPIGQNEICYIIDGNEKMMAEVIKIVGNVAHAQVYESTRGLKIGVDVEFSNHMLEVELGPGLLSKNYDGLQNDLDKKEGLFLKRGDYSPPLDEDSKFKFKPISKKGDVVIAADWLGEVKENWIDHKIMVPFNFEGKWTIKSIVEAGSYCIYDTIAILKNEKNEEKKVTMTQKWPVKIAIKTYKEKPRPFKIMETGIRVIDTFNPMAEGGTGFIPGPFGCGKTVLQHAISKNGDADLIIIAACGERANEVVEIFTEYPELIDPRTGRKLVERTPIICNTSNMPVAAREASVYTAMTIGEYYRAMGINVLLLADSTSRWAQAMREMSGRLEEIPGEEAFPAYLESRIAGFYERAGAIELKDGRIGSLTIGGTVSPAGGSFEEPVTQGTLKVVGAFHGLSRTRSDARRYPAIDPLESWSKYTGIIDPEKVTWVKALLYRGNEVAQMMTVMGEEGTSIEDFVIMLKAEFFDNCYLQQNAFDVVDAATSTERQLYLFKLLSNL
ncbi:MAG: V-type ATP synthase subunit A, partial [Spirochaetes bacterium]|nr:V-type ATP synthase subunit A [Spirochaetota bacterium]